MLQSADRLFISEDALPAFFARSPDATLLIAPGHEGMPWTILDGNDAACAVYGYAWNELVGQPVAILDSERTPSRTDMLLARVQREAALRVETVHRRNGGGRVDVELSLTPVPDSDRALIVAVIRDITTHKNTERRLGTQHAISRLLAGAGHFMDITTQMLQIIGEQLDWALGALWCVQGDSNTLRCTASWQAPASAAEGFETACRAISLEHGVGLPGDVWARNAPVWLADIRTARNFTRHEIAARAGLLSAFAFPITGPRSGTFGVMEFFSRETRPPDPELLDMAMAIGNAAGEYIERRRAETALRASEARKSAILETALDAIITIDHQGSVTEFNPAAQAIFGYRPEEVIGREMADLIIPPSLRERHRQGLLHYLATGDGAIIGQRIELTALRADGTEFPVELTITRIPADGPPVFTGFVRDITERKTAEARQQFLAEASTLLAASLDYNLTLENLAQLVVPRIADWCSINLFDDKGALVRVAARHVDREKEVILGDLREQHPPDPTKPVLSSAIAVSERATLVVEVTDALLQGLAQNAEQLEVYRAMGFRSGMLVPMHLGTRPLGIIILATAESGRHYNAGDLALAEELAQRAALAIENARLYRETQAAVQLRDQFLSIAAHELKTPVTALLGYSQLLQRRMNREPTANARDRRAVQVLAEQTERLGALVASLLDVSRLELGQFTLDRQPVDLCPLVRRVVEELQPTLPQGNPPHTVEWSCPDAPVVVDGDALRLEQVLQNLLQNAVKYSPQGGPIMVRVTREDGYAVLAVSDRGIGVPREAQAQLFQRFYRAAHAAARDISGMGIGLYVVREIVNRHGGTIEVESVEGAGSTFTVHLPLAAPAS